MTLDDIMKKLESLGDPKMLQHHAKCGGNESMFGVKLGDIRNMAKEIKSDHDLAMKLWATGNLDARLLATLILKPKLLSADELEKLVSDSQNTWLADWMN
jgi:3-methyladenine DNA glycosylase AlkD